MTVLWLWQIVDVAARRAVAGLQRAVRCACRDKVLPVLSLLPVVGPGEAQALYHFGSSSRGVPPLYYVDSA